MDRSKGMRSDSVGSSVVSMRALKVVMKSRARAG